MKIVVFGLTITSSWGNGHATLWRALCKALVRRNHKIVFIERDVPYYAAHRDLTELPGVELLLYYDWAHVRTTASQHLSEADAAFVTSYCFDALLASDLILDSQARVRCFYDLDSPVTLEKIQNGEKVPYIRPGGLGDFDLVLSFAGGPVLTELKSVLGAKDVAPLYGCVDADAYHPVPATDDYRSDLSFLGTYSEDRQSTLQELFIKPARLLADKQFRIGGAQYPQDFAWTKNIYFSRHVVPAQLPSFFCSSRLTLNVTRRAMQQAGWAPSGRLFEAAACGTPIVSDLWNGIESFYKPEREILIARTADDIINALQLSDRELENMAACARHRTLEEHSAERRAIDLENALDSVVAKR